MVLIVDAGTSSLKVLDTGRREGQVYPLEALQLVREQSVAYACGHNAHWFNNAQTVNEYSALMAAAINEVRDGVVLDIGARDTKKVTVANGFVKDFKLNDQCSAFAGYSLQMMNQFLPLRLAATTTERLKLPYTCAVYSLAEVLDLMKASPEIAARSFVESFLDRMLKFAGSRKIYLSGGVCENETILSIFREKADVTPLGRFLVCRGLTYMLQKGLSGEAFRSRLEERPTSLGVQASGSLHGKIHSPYVGVAAKGFRRSG